MSESEFRRLMLPDEGLPPDRHDHLKERVMSTIRSESGTTQPRPAPRPRSRRLVPALVSVLTLLVLGATAFAMGLFPRQAQHVLDQAGCRDASSVEELVAETQAADGRTFQFWVTRPDVDATPNGHILVLVDGEGNYLGLAAGCGMPGDWDETDLGDAWAVAPAEGSESETLISVMGRVPASATVARVSLSDGSAVEIPVQAGGYFLGLVYGPGIPGDTPPDFAEPVHIIAIDADGAVIAERNLP